MNDKYMKLAIKESKKAFVAGELPIGTVIIKNNVILSKSYNTKEKTKDVTCHAEINAIRKANKKIKDWRLDGCIMYVTMEPCIMCMGTIIESRIKKIICGVPNQKSHELNKILCATNNIKIEYGLMQNEISKEINDFFEKIRNK